MNGNGRSELAPESGHTHGKNLLRPLTAEKVVPTILIIAWIILHIFTGKLKVPGLCLFSFSLQVLKRLQWILIHIFVCFVFGHFVHVFLAATRHPFTVFEMLLSRRLPFNFLSTMKTNGKYIVFMMWGVGFQGSINLNSSLKVAPITSKTATLSFANCASVKFDCALQSRFQNSETRIIKIIMDHLDFCVGFHKHSGSGHN